MKLAFLGAGNMAGAMIQSILAADVLKGDEILLVNARNPAHGKETAARLGITAAEPAALRTADAIVFAMKPQDFSAAAAMYRSYLENQLVLSIMAGISFKKLEKELGALPFIRVMPNMGVSVRRGVTGYAIGARVTQRQAEFAHALLAAGGMAIRLEHEDEISKVIGVAGSSPAYFCLMLEALAGAAVRDGMEPEAAVAFARETFIGTAEILKAEPVSPETLRARISSKKGTTEAAVEAMLGAGFEIAVTAGYIRAVQKSDMMTAAFDAE
ncbi:MAG: pyrroline-5-carboxylate reductase [Christensenella sp.]|jgi:pyrroline-5-carboxylate reductase|nr:pyrroline-5-carboxylate reductase [Christensenella sp.]